MDYLSPKKAKEAFKTFYTFIRDVTDRGILACMLIVMVVGGDWW